MKGQNTRYTKLTYIKDAVHDCGNSFRECEWKTLRIPARISPEPPLLHNHSKKSFTLTIFYSCIPAKQLLSLNNSEFFKSFIASGNFICYGNFLYSPLMYCCYTLFPFSFTPALIKMASILHQSIQLKARIFIH